VKYMTPLRSPCRSRWSGASSTRVRRYDRCSFHLALKQWADNCVCAWHVMIGYSSRVMQIKVEWCLINKGEFGDVVET
jgi:hypothetical protein